MIKRIALASVAVFLVWSALDYVVHTILLQDLYAQTAYLWRPMSEMKLPLMYIVSFLCAVAFVVLYVYFVEPKSLIRGLLFGLVYGLAAGLSMGYGSFSVMPLPYWMAFTWCWGTVLQSILAGLVTAVIVGGGRK